MAVKKRKPKTDSMGSAKLNNYLKSHITDEHCSNTLMSTPIDEVGICF
jgi:hypothetical protein